ncbi:collagen-like protein [Bacteroides cellulosilyticus]|jgi:hypothetical protein|uniref:Collagen-like protein n=1 Tax=Bacteroides cellulosilyticus TaxID=246787 RepID=A0A412IFU6_9BACE|nr:collagen-like protein [Bacteroides cellulosilyticus]RGS35868.1 collagen-like protein [Bacteroides cellulosilyticus]
MAILSTAKIVGMLASAKKTGRQVMNAAGEWVAEVVEDFMSGFAGHGWKIWEYVKGKWMLEIDSIRVREQFIVFEMLVSKMRAIIGSLGISQACGKIATVTLSEDGTEYLITLEDETMSFVAHDFMRCQTYTGTKQTFYHVEISSVVDDVVHVPVSEFDRDAEGIVTNPPEPGNDIVQFGNSVNKNRQSAIYIHADESGQPAIDIMFDIDSKDWTGKVKTRLGGDIPGGDGARGFYCENGMIKGTDTSGHTVYCIHPDGSAEFGDGSAQFNADKSGHIAGGAISWAWDTSKNQFITSFKNVVIKWEDLDDEVKENLKGEKGDKGDKGDTGEKGGDGTNGADGINGKDGTSIIWQGSFASHPSNPQNGWAYKNTTDGKSYVYQDGTWYQMTIDGVDGANGKDGADGLDIVWKGDLSTPPINPVKNWVYRDIDNGRVYIYNGTAWALMVADGNDGTNGAAGTNGLSVYITYHDSESQPAVPTGNGTSDGWHTNATNAVVWMSQKIAASSSTGSWGTPIKIKGNKGDTGPQGVPGTPGKDGKVYYTWIKYADDAQGNGISNDPTGKSFIGLAYNKETATESNTASDYTWSRFRGFDGQDGKDGTDGVPGAPGADGKTTYTWIAYSDNADGSDMYQIPTDNTKYIGIAVNKDTATESNNPADYTWSRFRGEDGEDAVMYTIEFYIQGLLVDNIACDIHSKPIAGNTLVAKLFRIKGSTKELYSAGNWIVNHWLNGTEVSDLDYSSPRNSVEIAIVDDFDSISVGISGGSNSDDPVISASGTVSKVMSNVPDWLVGWDTNKVQIGSEYMISPKLFTGKNTGTAEEPILTGIVQGDKCITIDGVERSGIYALVENEVVFELDPENGKYKFNGEVNATSGVFKNIKSPNESFKINEAGEIEIVGKVSTSSNGTRIEIDPDTNSIKMYNQNDTEVGSLSFFEFEWNGVINYLPRLRLRRYVNNVLNDEVSITNGIIFCSQKSGSDNYSCQLVPSHGLTFFKNEEPTKYYLKA